MNSKKIILSVSLATAVLATGIISQEEEAHADSVDKYYYDNSQSGTAPVSYRRTICIRKSNI